MSSTKIARLTSLTSHQLEAEQVIQDLVAAVKELVENALDANSESIIITFINYGFDAIIIEDDGDGISKENMSRIGSDRYATSKIVEEADLETSLSYGFRGEALHSIVNLARKVSILSASDNSGSGICKTFSNFGTSITSLDKPRTKGTTISIESLFESISIRRQDWFKRKSICFAQAIFLLQSFAILTLKVKFFSFNIKENSSKFTVLHSVGKDFSSRFSECIRSDYKNIENFIDTFILKDEKCTVEGVFVRHLKANQKSRFVVFINRKPFESPKWQKYFQQMLNKNFTHGVEIFMSVCIPGLWIDFNVTPDKRTIFILNEADILKHIVISCEKLLQKDLLIETRDPEMPKNNFSKLQEKAHRSCNQSLTESCCWDEAFLSVGAADAVQLSKEDLVKLKAIGQFNNGFIICSKILEGFTELFAIDQHAADERIRFEEIASSYSISCQKLVSPIKMKLSPGDEHFVVNNIDIIRTAGFLVKETESGFLLEAVPNFHGAEANIEDFYELIGYMQDHGLLYKNLCPKLHRVLASRACRSAVMIGSPLTNLQIQKILDKLSNTDYPWICAHGRPTVQFLKRINHPTD